MNLLEELKINAVKIVSELYKLDCSITDILLDKTRKEIEGDYTLVVFPFVKHAKKAPDKVAEEIGQAFTSALEYVEGFNVIKKKHRGCSSKRYL